MYELLSRKTSPETSFCKELASVDMYKGYSLQVVQSDDNCKVEQSNWAYHNRTRRKDSENWSASSTSKEAHSLHIPTNSYAEQLHYLKECVVWLNNRKRTRTAL